MKRCIAAVVAACVSMACLAQGKSTAKPELVWLQIVDAGMKAGSYPLSWALVLYPERACPFTNINGHESMIAATMTSVPVCAGVTETGKNVLVAGPSVGVQTFSTVLFAHAKVNPDGQSASIIETNFDAGANFKRYLDEQKKIVEQSRPGAPLPPRGSAP